MATGLDAVWAAGDCVVTHHGGKACICTSSLLGHRIQPVSHHMRQLVDVGLVTASSEANGPTTKSSRRARRARRAQYVDQITDDADSLTKLLRRLRKS